MSLWVCPCDKSPLIEVRISKFWPKMHLSTVKVPIDFWDWLTSIFRFFFLQTSYFFPNFASLSFICVVSYIFSEAIASECSTSHMAVHIYWFSWMWTGSHHGLWNSLPLYLGETIGVSASLDSANGTGFYKLLWVFAILYTLRMLKFYMPTLINHQNNSKQCPLAFIVSEFQAGEACLSTIFSVVNTKAIQDTRLFHILTSFLHVGPLDMLTPGAVSLALNCEWA